MVIPPVEPTPASPEGHEWQKVAEVTATLTKEQPVMVVRLTIPPVEPAVRLTKLPTYSKGFGFGMIGKVMMTGALIIFGIARLFDGDYFETIVCEALAFILMETGG